MDWVMLLVLSVVKTSKQWMDGLEGRDFELEHALLGRGGGYTYDFMIESLHTLHLLLDRAMRWGVHIVYLSRAWSTQ
jgi:hypothetical protein